MAYRYRVSQIGESLIDLIFQCRCPLCDRPAAASLCATCQRQIYAQQYPSRQTFWRSDLPIFPWGRYSGALRQSLSALKYERQPRIAQLLGSWLAQAWLTSAECASLPQRFRIVVVPIPMYAEKRRQRGYDQAVLIARQFCTVTRLPLRQRGLIRERATTAQFGLSAKEREANLSGAFCVSSGLLHSKVSVLLIDDIYTTGATARAAADALRQAALPVSGLLAVASPQLTGHTEISTSDVRL